MSAAKKTTTARKAEAAERLGTYEVTSPLNHDGELYAVGDTVELSDAAAAPLLGLAVKAPEADAG